MKWFLESYAIFGWSGCLLIVASSLVTAAAYRGKHGERYSISRNFISELGKEGVSRLAGLFNGGLILGSFLLILMMPGVGISLNSVWGYIGMVAGIIAATASMFVGIFPMNKLQLHIVAATTFFRAGLPSMVLFSIAIALQPAAERVIPLYTLVFGVIGVAAYTAFLLNVSQVIPLHTLVFGVIGTEAYTTFLVYAGQLEKKQKASALDSQQAQARPRFWLMPFLEWMVLISTLLWYLVICVVR